MTLLPPGQELNVAYLMEERKQRIDKDNNAPPFDDLRNFTFEGSGSIAESLSSLASGKDISYFFSTLSKSRENISSILNWKGRNSRIQVHGTPLL